MRSKNNNKKNIKQHLYQKLKQLHILSMYTQYLQSKCEAAILLKTIDKMAAWFHKSFMGDNRSYNDWSIAARAPLQVLVPHLEYCTVLRMRLGTYSDA